MFHYSKTAALFLLTICLFFSESIYAQCGDRYQKDLFPNIKTTTVTYSDTFQLKMDIYEPEGDALKKRPLVVLAFGGSFITGGRTLDPTITELCTYLAKKGYVTASIDYRLAENAMMMLDSAYSVNTVIKAVSDGKAAIRYFIKDAETENKYRINVDKIFAGGNSAGAVLYMHAGYVNQLNEVEPGLQQAFQDIGGLEGNSGNPGYTYKFKGIINLAGGLHNTAYVSADDPSSFNTHGSIDNVVPFNCNKAMNGAFINLCGLGALQPIYDSMKIDHFSHVYNGQGHVPWADDSKIFDSVKTELTTYLYDRVCEKASGVAKRKLAEQIQVYPNPANDLIYIQSPKEIKSFRLYNGMGQLVFEQKNIGKQMMQINTSAYPSGFYYLKIQGKDFEYGSKLLINH